MLQSSCLSQSSLQSLTQTCPRSPAGLRAPPTPAAMRWALVIGVWCLLILRASARPGGTVSTPGAQKPGLCPTRRGPRGPACPRSCRARPVLKGPGFHQSGECCRGASESGLGGKPAGAVPALQGLTRGGGGGGALSWVRPRAQPLTCNILASWAVSRQDLGMSAGRWPPQRRCWALRVTGEGLRSVLETLAPQSPLQPPV